MPLLPDFLNPKKVNADREEAAERDPAPPQGSTPASAPTTRFGKPFTPEQRAKQKAALVQKLRERAMEE